GGGDGETLRYAFHGIPSFTVIRNTTPGLHRSHTLTPRTTPLRGPAFSCLGLDGTKVVSRHLMVGRRASMRRALVALLFWALAGGCGGGEIPESKLPAWAGHSTELFDDVIEPRAVGLELNVTATPRSDPTLRERTQIGDAVLRVRVDTVTQSGYGKQLRHQLTLNILEKMAGEHPPPPNFVVTMDES